MATRRVRQPEWCDWCRASHEPPPAGLARFGPPAGRWPEVVNQHKRKGRYQLALVILEASMRATEAHVIGVVPWCYEQAAIIHRKRRDRDAELAVLRRFAAQRHLTGPLPGKLLERLARLEARGP